MHFKGLGGLKTYALTDGGSRVEVLPSRGALVTRMSVAGDEVLFLDESTVVDPTKNVRGGIPVLFPIAGPLPGDTYLAEGRSWSLPQHGFARRLAWEVRREEEALLVLGLTSSNETLRQYPWHFDAQLRFSLAGARLELGFEVENQDIRPMPVQLGYHPYFRVPQGNKAAARVETDATLAWDNRVKREVPFTGFELSGPEVDLHLRDHSSPGTTLHRGEGLRPVRLAWSPGFRTLVVWTLQGRDFVCVEPWTAPGGALATGAGVLSVAPGARVSLSFSISV